MPNAAPTTGKPWMIRAGARRFAGVVASLLSSALVAGPLTIITQQRNGQPLSGAVVTIHALSAVAAPAPPVRAVLDQVDLAFVPDVLVIPVNSSVNFPNSDAVSHQVYSFSPARSFQLPLYRGKPYPPVVFDRPGVVTLGCNIHDGMLAYVIVTDAPVFGRTDERGEFSAGALPAGRHRVSVWHPRLSEPAVERTFEVDAGEQRVELVLQRALRPAPLAGKPRSWDY